MTNLEKYKKELKELFYYIDIEPCIYIELSDKHKCNDCPLFNEKGFCDTSKLIDWLSDEYCEPIILTKIELDIINHCRLMNSGDHLFSSVSILNTLSNEGHYKGVSDINMTLDEILDNYVIVADGYDGFEECK